MTTWICLLRGINVGGRNSVAMKDLTAAFTQLGFAEIRTYIQSGNIVFHDQSDDAAALHERISNLLRDTFGIPAKVFLLTLAELEHIADQNPFPRAAEAPGTLHAYILASDAIADSDRLNALSSQTERFELRNRVFYLHAPDGVGRSKLAQGVEKVLRVPLTARNWRTVLKVLAMARQLDGDRA